MKALSALFAASFLFLSGCYSAQAGQCRVTFAQDQEKAARIGYAVSNKKLSPTQLANAIRVYQNAPGDKFTQADMPDAAYPAWKDDALPVIVFVKAGCVIAHMAIDPAHVQEIFGRNA